MNRYSHLNFAMTHQCRGYTTLAMSLIILTAITFISLYGAQNSIMKQRILSNEVRAVEAFDRSEGGIERGIMFLSQNRGKIGNDWVGSTGMHWVQCSNTATALPCGNGTGNLFDDDYVYLASANGNTFVDLDNTSPDTGDISILNDSNVYFVAPCQDEEDLDGDGEADGNGTCDDIDGSGNMAPPAAALIHVIGAGIGSDGTASAITRQSVYLYKMIASTPSSPVSIRGASTVSGSFDLVTSANGGGTGVPLSIWTNETVSVGTALNTCYEEEYFSTGSPYSEDGITKCDDCGCPTDDDLKLTHSGGAGIDIQHEQTDFPTDMFDYVFGTASADYENIKNQADVVSTCSELNANSAGLYWVTSECAIGSGDEIGSVDNPVLIVVADAPLKMNGGEVYGVIFSFDVPDDTGDTSITTNGNGLIYGGFISDHEPSTMNGTMTIHFEQNVLNNLAFGSNARGVGKVPGSWADYNTDN